MRLRQLLPIAAGILIFLAHPALIAAQAYVAVLGSDANPGTAQQPFATVQRAIQTGSSEILVESGDYIFDNPVVVPAGVSIRGGYYRNTEDGGVIKWYADTRATNFLVNVQAPGFQIFPRPAAFIVHNLARLQRVTIKGGWYSAELLPGGHLLEVDFAGGVFAAVYLRTGQENLSALVERCRVTGGGNGIRVEGDANAIVDNVLVENTLSRSVIITGTGDVSISNSVFQRSDSFGVFIQGNSNVVVQNCVIRRHASDGFRIAQAAPLIRGCLIELCQDGISLQQADGADIENCTIARNRDSAIYVRDSQSNLRRNVISDHINYGIFEDKPGETAEVPPRIHLAAVDHNLFWNNTPANYFDEGFTDLNSAAEINASVNTVPATGNIVGDPLFYDPSLHDYQLTAGSPAIDAANTIALYTADLEGNPRAIDVPSVGGTGAAILDLGAYERQLNIATRFASEFRDVSTIPDPFNPGQNGQIQRSPRWIWNNTSPAVALLGNIYPGRLRLGSVNINSFGGLGRELLDDMKQPADKVCVTKIKLAADGTSNIKVPRLRVNNAETIDSIHTVSVVGSQVLAPNFAGREYDMIYDLRQGQYHSIPFNEKSEFTQVFAFDLLDYLPQQYRDFCDMTSYELTFVDRTTFDAQFTQLAKAWTFAPSETFEWIAGGAPPGFNSPALNYDPARESLRYTQFAPDTFGGWGSPIFDLPAGKLVRVECQIASPLPKDQAPHFRLRLNTAQFDIAYELVVISFTSGFSAPDGDGELYTLYGRVPSVPELLKPGNLVEMGVALDILGFQYDPRPPSTIMYLDDVKIWVAP